MKKIKVGLPRTNFYYKDGIFWKNFLINLGCKVILSHETNYNQIEAGINNLHFDNCLINKVYLGHIIQLSDTCDYILIHTNCENSYKCPNYKMLKSKLNKTLISSQPLYYNNVKHKLISKIKIALKITKNPLKIIIGYIKALKKQKDFDKNKYNNNKNKINDLNKKILLVGNYGIIENNYYMNNIVSKLNINGFTILYSSSLPPKESIFFSQFFKDKKIERETKKVIGPIYYYQYIVNGIIYIKNNNCQLDDYIYNEVKEDITNNIIKELNIEGELNDVIIEKNIELILNLVKKHQQKKF